MAYDAAGRFSWRALAVGWIEAPRRRRLRVDRVARLQTYLEDVCAFPGAVMCNGLALACPAAKNVIDRADDNACFLARQFVINRFAFAARRDQSVGAQARKL